MAARWELSRLVRSALQQRLAPSARVFSTAATASVVETVSPDQCSDGSVRSAGSVSYTVTTESGELRVAPHGGVKSLGKELPQMQGRMGVRELTPASGMGTTMKMSTLAAAQQRREAPEVTAEQLAALSQSLDAMWQRNAEVGGVAVGQSEWEQGLGGDFLFDERSAPERFAASANDPNEVRVSDRIGPSATLSQAEFATDRFYDLISYGAVKNAMPVSSRPARRGASGVGRYKCAVDLVGGHEMEVAVV